MIYKPSLPLVFVFSLIFSTLCHAAEKESSPSKRPIFEPIHDRAGQLGVSASVLAPGMPKALVRAARIEIRLAELQPNSPTRGMLTARRGVPGQLLLVQLVGRSQPNYLRIEEVIDHGHSRSLIGKVVSDPESSFTISMQGNSVIGKIHMDGYLWVIQPWPSLGGHVMKQIDKSRIPSAAYRNDTTAASYQASNKSARAPSNEESNKALSKLISLPENGNVRVLFLYTPDVQSTNNVTTLTSNIVAEMNSSLDNSNVPGNFYVTKAGQQLVNDNFVNECKVDIISDMVGRDGVFSNIDAQLASAEADLALLLVTTETSYSCNPYWGTGRIGGVAIKFGLYYNMDDPGDHPFALSTDSYAISDLTAIHEIGHVLGGYHASNTDPILPEIGFSYVEGWAIDDADPFQTIMGGYEVCAFNPSQPPQSQNCTRIPYWSDTSLSVDGHVIGDSDSRMADALSGTASKPGIMAQVAAWRPYSNPRPATPSNFSVRDEKCYGLHKATWSSVTGVEEYQLLRSLNANFTSPDVIHAGSGTSAFFNVSSGTWYLRVRACNGSGCSANSVQRSASYYPGCL